ncbi:taste receptor type 2 member 9-like [Dendropsophus ebraccatus]|uniref:taste receptor type 2 member 9-like n=1 Tax=Dendropsophus ebraccatus TaxID=150705 RepID=UPI00383100B0
MADMNCDSLSIPNPLGVFLSLVTIITVVSLLGNGFIIVVNIRDWLKGKSLNPVDQILVALSLSNAVLSYNFGNYIFFLYLWPQLFLEGSAFIVVFSLMTFLEISSSWLTAWLCLYFFVKILHFKSFYLVKLKVTIDVAVPWLIGFSVVVAFSSTLLLIRSFIGSSTHNSTLYNYTCPIVPFQVYNTYNTLILGFNSDSAFVIVLVSTVCIVWSLCRHTYRMKKSMCVEEYSRLRTHQKAAQTVVSLLLIYVVFYVTYILMTSLFFSNNSSIYYFISVWVSQSTSPAMSVVLIRGNSKLSLALHKIFSRSHH